MLYPIRGAGLLNEYQLLAKRSLVRATAGDSIGAMTDAERVRQSFQALNDWTYHYNEEIKDGKWAEFFNWQPYHWARSEKIDPPLCTPSMFKQARQGPSPRFLSVDEALSAGGVKIESETAGEISIWMKALTPVRNFSKAPEDNVFCHVTAGPDSFDASATPINNVWHSPYIGPMWSRVGVLHLKKGENNLCVTQLKPGARIDRIFLGLYPPFPAEPRMRIPACDYRRKHDSREGSLVKIEQLGFVDGLLVQPFDTPSYAPDEIEKAPYAEYDLNLQAGDSVIEIRTLPTLHVYEGRDARYAVQLGDGTPQVFSIHAGDFSAEWRLNVLRGYASRTLRIPSACRGTTQRLRIYLLDPGIVLQEILVQAE